MESPHLTTAHPGALSELNLAGQDLARTRLQECCGSSRWAELMAARRPYASSDAVLAGAEACFDQLTEADWHDAFAAHARIGQPNAGDEQGRGEQAGALAAGAGQREALRTGNAEYERRFGHVFLICATGLSAEAMLNALLDRLGHDPVTELRIAAGEQRKITRLRLAGLLAA